MTTLDLVYGEGTPLVGDITPSGGHERSPDTFHLRFDPESEPVGHAVVKAASFVHNVDQTDLSPLAETVEPDALEALVGGHARGDREPVEVTFTYEDLQITVAGDGNIWLQWC